MSDRPERVRQKPSMVARLAAFLLWTGLLERSEPATRPSRPALKGRAGGDDAVYAAFISYSRAVDGKLAPALQGALQRFAKPWYRPRALRVFRDDAVLTATPGLWPSIDDALTASRSFILLASPESARSEWVAREVNSWCQRKPLDKLFVALTGGDIVWDGRVGDFDWERTTALPPSLRHVFADEPRYVDLRWARTEDHVSLAHPRFRDCVADLAAPLHDRPKDDLVGEEVHQHRRTVRLVRTAITTLTALTLLAAGSALFAVDQRDTARDERNRAEESARLATSRRLAVQADARAASRPALSTLLSLAAWQTADTPEARSSLLNQMQRTRDIRGRLWGHDNLIYRVAFSPDGRLLASGGADNTIRLWDVSRRVPLGALKGHGRTVLSVAFSPDGRLLASGSVDDTIRLWDVSRRVPLGVLKGHTGEVWSVAFSPDGRLLVSGSVDQKVMLWDVTRRTRLGVLNDHTGWVRSVAFSPGGRILASGSHDGTIRLWAVDRQAREGPLRISRAGTLTSRAKVYAIAFAPDGRTLASAGASSAITTWDLDRRTRAATLSGNDDTVLAVAFSPDGQILASAGDTLTLWSPARRVRVKALDGHAGIVRSVAFSPDGRTLASGGDDHVAILWDPGDNNWLGRPLSGLAGAARLLAFSPDGRILAAASETTVRLWDIPRAAQLVEVTPDEAVESMALSPDGRVLAVAGEKTILLWNVAQRARIGALTSQLPFVAALAFSGDGQLLASAAGADITVWDVRRRVPLRVLKGHTRDVQTLAFGADGRTLASGSLDQTVRLWDAVQGTDPVVLRGHENVVASVAFSPDGRTLASGGGDASIILWDVARHAQAGTLDNGGPVWQVTFSPDRRILAAAGGPWIVLWDVGQRFRLGAFGGPADVTSVAFSPDGLALASGNDAGSTTFWTLDVASWRRRLCIVSGRDITGEEWGEFLPGVAYRETCT